jgi:hypothetical protein
MADHAVMPLLLFVILVLLVLGAFGGGLARPAFRGPGIGLGTVLLIVLLLWAFGVFGTRPF